MTVATAAGTVAGEAPPRVPMVAATVANVRTRREPALESGVSSSHLDPLINDGVGRDTVVLLLEVLPVDLVGVGA
jgi:hypothetical protein